MNPADSSQHGLPQEPGVRALQTQAQQAATTAVASSFHSAAVVTSTTTRGSAAMHAMSNGIVSSELDATSVEFLQTGFVSFNASFCCKCEK